MKLHSIEIANARAQEPPCPRSNHVLCLVMTLSLIRWVEERQTSFAQLASTSPNPQEENRRLMRASTTIYHQGTFLSLRDPSVHSQRQCELL